MHSRIEQIVSKVVDRNNQKIIEEQRIKEEEKTCIQKAYDWVKENSEEARKIIASFINEYVLPNVENHAPYGTSFSGIFIEKGNCKIPYTLLVKEIEKIDGLVVTGLSISKNENVDFNVEFTEDLKRQMGHMQYKDK